MQIAQHMQISIRQFLYTGDPYFTFLQKNFGELNISGLTMGLYGLATRLLWWKVKQHNGTFANH